MRPPRNLHPLGLGLTSFMEATWSSATVQYSGDGTVGGLRRRAERTFGMPAGVQSYLLVEKTNKPLRDELLLRGDYSLSGNGSERLLLVTDGAGRLRGGAASDVDILLDMYSAITGLNRKRGTRRYT